MNSWSNNSGIMRISVYVFLCGGPSWFTTNMFLKTKEEFVQTTVHRNGINITVERRVGEVVNSGFLANRSGWSQLPYGPCGSFQERTSSGHSQKGFDLLHQPWAHLSTCSILEPLKCPGKRGMWDAINIFEDINCDCERWSALKIFSSLLWYLFVN